MFHLLYAINAASKAHLPLSAPKCTAPVSLEPLMEPVGPTLGQVVLLLSDLFAGVTLEATASRRGVNIVVVRRVIDAICPAAMRLLGEAATDSLHQTDEQALAAMLSISAKVNINFKRLSESRWLHSKKLAEKCEQSDLRALASSWLCLVHFGTICTPPTEMTTNFVKGLKAVGIHVQRIVVRINPCANADAITLARSTNFLKHQFHAHFGASPQFDENRHRRGRASRHGRPPLFLMVLSRAIGIGEVAPPALNDTQTLNALMLSIVAHTNLNTSN